MTEKQTTEADFWDHEVQEPRRLSFRRRWYAHVMRHLTDRLLACLGNVDGRRVLFVGCGDPLLLAGDCA